MNPQILFQTILHWIDGLGVTGGLAFIVIYIIATVACVPGTILTLGAGVVFGVALGSVYAWTGATLGAIAAFLVALSGARLGQPKDCGQAKLCRDR